MILTPAEQALTGTAEAYIRALFENEFSGHDAAHSLRVCRTALVLAAEEGAEPLTTALAALLHDVDDPKLSPETAAHKDRARAFLEAQGIGESRIACILKAIDEVSFKGTDSVRPTSPEGACVQDADRLDALGAIGVARAFAYGGSRGRVMHDPSEPPALGLDEAGYRSHVSTTVNHFYEKLFLLKDMMNTPSGRREATRREAFMRDFLAEFLKEWEGE